MRFDHEVHICQVEDSGFHQRLHYDPPGSRSMLVCHLVVGFAVGGEMGDTRMVSSRVFPT